MPPLQPQTQPASVRDTLSGQLTQVVGKLVANSGSQSADLVTALNAIAAAINAKPSV